MSKMIFKGEFHKVDKVSKVVYGWAYVSEEDGGTVVDHSGDIWPVEELEKSAHDFVMNCGVGKVMHTGEQQTTLVESIVFTKAKQETLGIDLGKIGWFVGFKVEDEDILKRIETGELAMFSIGGSGTREVI